MGEQVLRRLEAQQAQLRVLNRCICLMLDEYSEMDEFLDQVVSIIHEELGYNHFGIGLMNEQNQIILRAWYGIPEESIAQLTAVAGQGVVGWVLQCGKPLLVPDVRLEPRYCQWRSTALSGLCVPLLSRRHVIGIINAESDRLDRFTERDLELLTTLAAVVSGILGRITQRRAAAEREAQRLSSLTNREREVLRSLVEGKANKEIAKELKIKESTVETHMKHLFAKLGVRTRTEAALWAGKDGQMDTGNQW